jgi:hypothetical protein
MYILPSQVDGTRSYLPGQPTGTARQAARLWRLVCKFMGSFLIASSGIRKTTTTWKVPTITKVETGPLSCYSELMKRNSQMTQGGRPFLHLFARYLLSIPLLSTSLSNNAASLLNEVVNAPSIRHESWRVGPWTRVTLSGKPSQSLLSLQIIQSMPTIETVLACRQTTRMINVLLWIIRGRVCHWRTEGL